MINEWKNMSDHDLQRNLKEYLMSSGDAHLTFVKTLYPMISDVNFKNIVDRILLNNAKFPPSEEEILEFKGRTLEVCAMLNIPGTREVVLDVIHNISDPLGFKDPTYFPYLNVAIRELRLEEAKEFLCRELEVISNLSESAQEYLWCYRSAIWALEIIDPILANQYSKRLKLYPERLPLFEWNCLSYQEIKTEVKKVILGWGMTGSTSHFSFIPEYYAKIKDFELRQKVDKILIELIDDIKSGIAGRAVYVCANLQLENAKEKILSATQRSNDIFIVMEKTTLGTDWSIYFEYLLELNSAVKRLNIIEAKYFLIKQLDPLKGPMPESVTKEYYLYHLAQCALDALKKIDPELAKKYT